MSAAGRPSSGPRHALVSGGRSPRLGAWAGLLGELKSLGERGGASVGDAYARAASSLLKRLERLEDRRAERRFQRHRSAPTANALPPKTLPPAP